MNDSMKAFADEDGYVLEDIISFVREVTYMAPPRSATKTRGQRLLDRLLKAREKDQP